MNEEKLFKTINSSVSVASKHPLKYFNDLVYLNINTI